MSSRQQPLRACVARAEKVNLDPLDLLWKTQDIPLPWPLRLPKCWAGQRLFTHTATPLSAPVTKLLPLHIERTVGVFSLDPDYADQLLFQRTDLQHGNVTTRLAGTDCCSDRLAPPTARYASIALGKTCSGNRSAAVRPFTPMSERCYMATSGILGTCLHIGLYSYTRLTRHSLETRLQPGYSGHMRTAAPRRLKWPTNQSRLQSVPEAGSDYTRPVNSIAPDAN